MDIETQIEKTYDALDTPFNFMGSITTHQIISNIQTNLSTLISIYQQFPTIDYTEEIETVNSILTTFNNSIQKINTSTDDDGLNSLRIKARNDFYKYFKSKLYEYTKGGPSASGRRMSYRSRKMKKHKKSKSYKKIRKGKRTKRRRY